MRSARRIVAWLAVAGLYAVAGTARAEPPWIDAAARGDMAILPMAAQTDGTATAGGRLPLPPVPPAGRSTVTVGRAVPAAAGPSVSMDFAPGDPAATPRPGVIRPAKPASAKPERTALPLPPTPPFPALGRPMDILLPYSGLSVRPLPDLPRLQAYGPVAAHGPDRPYAGFNAQTDCILDHQRFDSRGVRQRYPHPCGPTRDLDFDQPAFTTR